MLQRGGEIVLWDVVITSFRLNVSSSPAKLLERLLGLGAEEAKMLVKRFPSTVRAGLGRDDAQRLEGLLVRAGAKVELRPHADLGSLPMGHLARDIANAAAAALESAQRAPRGDAADLGTAATLLAAVHHLPSQAPIEGAVAPSVPVERLAMHPPFVPAARAPQPMAHVQSPAATAPSTSPAPTLPTELTFIEEPRLSRFSLARITRSPLQPLFHGLAARRSRADQKPSTPWPARPRGFVQSLVYPLVLAQALWIATPGPVAFAGVAGAAVVVAMQRKPAQEKRARRRALAISPALLARHAPPSSRDAKPSRKDLIAALPWADDGSERVLLPRVAEDPELVPSRALALARIYAGKPVPTAAEPRPVASATAARTTTPRGEEPLTSGIGATLGRSEEAAPADDAWNDDDDTERTEASADDASGLDDEMAAELDPVLDLVPQAMRRSMAALLRKNVQGVHNVGIDWPAETADDARERGVQCMIVESRDGNGEQRVRRLLRTGYEVPMTQALETELRDHVEVLRLANGTDAVDFIPLCLEI